MTRRKRTDGAEGLQQIVSDAALGAIPPLEDINLNAAQLVIWNRLVQVKARRAWTEQDLYMLSDLCVARSFIAEMQNSLDSLAITEDNMPMIAKLQSILDVNVKRARVLAITLQIHTEATQGKSNKQVEQNKTHRAAKGYVDKDDSDGLIPRPSTH